MIKNMPTVKESPDLEYWDPTWSKENKCLYNLVYGGRGNGKSFGLCRMILEEFLDNSNPSVYVRRFQEEIRPQNISQLFNPHLDYIKEKTGGKYNTVAYRSQQFWLEFRDSANNRLAKSEPFCYTASINTAMTRKGQDVGFVRYLVFDEFLSREGYLKNEFVLFTNVISTYIRTRGGTSIYLLGNTVDEKCPYWREFGIYNYSKIKQGDKIVYEYGASGLSLGLEYCKPLTSDPDKVVTPTSKYFAFNNPKLKMITDGEWERPDFTRPPAFIDKADVKLKFYIHYLEDYVTGNVVLTKDRRLFIWFYPSSKKSINEIDNDKAGKLLVFQEHTDGHLLHIVNPAYCNVRIALQILNLIKAGQSFYSDGQTAETVRAYHRSIGINILN